MRLKDKAALITGAGAGIGKAIAMKFAREGARVVIADIKNSAAVAEAITASGGKAASIITDVTSASDVEKMVAFTVDTYGCLDIMVNNAGIYMAKPFTEVNEDEWDRMMSVNVKGTFLGCKYAVEQMLKQGGGVIINMSSVSGLVGAPLSNLYCSTKGAVILLSKALSVELQPKRIRVNTICPTLVDSDMGKQVMDNYGKQGMVRTRELITVEDVANAALFLASDESRFITGHQLIIGAAGRI